MTFGDYTYRGLMASTWDLSRGDTSTWTDRLFYLEVVRKYGAPVLDVGCGTGRILLDFVAQGIDIDGVDDSPEMLAICREKAKQLNLSIDVRQQKMESLGLPRRYGTILVPSSTLQLLTDLDDAREAMRRFFAHLLPGGAFVTAFGFDWRAGDPLDTGWLLKFEKIRDEDGAIVRGWDRTWHEPEHQLWHDEERFEIERDGQLIASERLRRSPSGRWYTQQQAVQLMRDAGFSEVRSFSGFSRAPATAEDRLFCIIATRAASG
jgi:ubiquinone/menaquinone biosynthesis C-methylase UbiE